MTNLKIKTEALAESPALKIEIIMGDGSDVAPEVQAAVEYRLANLNPALLTKTQLVEINADLLAALDECLAWHELDDHRARPAMARESEMGRAMLARARAAIALATEGRAE